MATVRFPTANSIFEAAAKYGLAVRIHYGANGKIDNVETIGKVEGENGVASVNPWDQVLSNAEKRPS